MRTLLLGALWALPHAVSAYNYTTQNPKYISVLDDRPKDCPPCFNCLLPAFKCQQFAECRKYDGQCECPAGFGGQDCKEPTCGALSDGKDRYVREGKTCECKDGWNGINCNVCTKNSACAPMMPEGIEGVCYKGGITVKENYQMCQVTNRKILDQLKGQIPQVTFSCEGDSHTCGFQFWVDQRESFYCGLKECEWKLETNENGNYTHYDCNKINCECIKDRMLCGEGGSIDLSDFLTDEIKGPASFSCESRGAGGLNDDCSFSEPNMNELIKNIFGDKSITLDCNSGECLHPTQMPGYKAPTKKINSPLIAGAIAGSLLVLLAIVLLIVYITRRNSQRAGLGPVHLPMDDDDNAKLITEHKPASLHFEDVSYAVNGRSILTGVHGAVNPGQIMAIMGASGAGKTTFLDILARKNKRGVVSGKVLINGHTATDEEFREVIGFVDQDDTMMPTLTVYETILNSALLRLPREMKFEAKNRRVLEVMQQLGIFAIKDQLIGSEDSQRGISGGEKRRVGIACELVTSPAILFLDEPTSGLDSFNAYNVIECLVNLAQNYNRTIVFTIHQPRSNIVALFDRLVLLAKGKMVYSGEYKRCQSYFSDLGYTCPPGFNIADYLVDLTMHASQQHSVPVEYTDDNDVETTTESSTSVQRRRVGRKRGDSVRDRQERALFTRKNSSHQQPSSAGEEVPLLDVEEDHGRRTNSVSQDRADELIEDADPPPASGIAQTDLDVLITSYEKSEEAKRIRNEIHQAITEANGHSGENGDANQQLIGNGPVKGFERIGWWSQFAILSSRTWKNLYRNPMLMLTHYAIAILLAVLCGFLFYGITDDISGFQNRMGLFFFVLALFGFSTLTTLTVFSQERLLFMRERANGYYSPITYFGAKVVFDILPLRILPPIIMGSIIYPMVGLNNEWHSFFKFILVLVLFNLAAAAICLFIGIVFKDLGMANLVGSLVMLFSLLLAGLLLNHDSIPKSALWLQMISIFHYGFEALIVNEVRYLSLTEHKYGLDIEVPGATILSTFGFQSLAYWDDVIGLAIFSGAFIVLAYAAMHFILIEKR